MSESVGEPVNEPLTAGRFARILLGVYLAVHFALLLPYGAEVFSNRGVLPDAAASPLAHLFPNVLAVLDAPWFVSALLGGGVVLSGLLAAGKHERKAALGLWYLWACLLGRNPLIANPGLPYVGWLLLAHAAGSGPDLRRAAWILMAVGYTYSGLTKLPSPSWLDGTAVARVLECPLARPGPVRDALRGAPFLPLLTWGALALEVGFAPLSLSRRARPLLWGAMLGMHVGLLAIIDFADLTFGMIVLHAYTFDPAWVRSAPGSSAQELGHAPLGDEHAVVLALDVHGHVGERAARLQDGRLGEDERAAGARVEVGDVEVRRHARPVVAVLRDDRARPGVVDEGGDRPAMERAAPVLDRLAHLHADDRLAALRRDELHADERLVEADRAEQLSEPRERFIHLITPQR